MTTTIYRDTANAKLAGVVAGLANHFGWNVCYARWGWAIATVIWPPVMIAAYLLMAWLLDPAPAAASARAGLSTEAFDAQLKSHLAEADRATSPLRTRFSDVRDRFSRLEQRLRAMETAVTSREFQMDRELRRTP
jgi:phage shock protein C